MCNDALDNYLSRNYYITSTTNDSKLFNDFPFATNQLKIIYKKSRNARIDVLTIEGDANRYIIWDSSFWDLFTEFLFLSCEPKCDLTQDGKLLLESCGFACASICNYLSKKFDNPHISKKLKNYAYRLGYNLLTELLNLNPAYDVHGLKQNVFLAKIFVINHEVAHIRFIENQSVYQKNVEWLKEFVGNYSRLYPAEAGEDKRFNTALDMILNNKFVDKQIEELVADFYSIGHILRLFGLKPEDRKIPEDKKILVSNLLYSVNAMNRFIVFKSILDNIWNTYLDNESNKPKRTSLDECFESARLIVMMYSIIPYSVELGQSHHNEIVKANEYIDLLMKILDSVLIPQSFLDIINSEYELPKQPMSHDSFMQMQYLWHIEQHISNLSADTSEKYLQFIFNKAEFIKTNNPAKAIILYEEFIKMNTLKNGENHRENCNANAKIARLKIEQGDCSIATNNLIIAVEILKHQDISILETAYLYNNIGNVYKKMCEEQTALQYYFKSSNIRLGCGDVNSIDTFIVFTNIAESCVALGSETIYQGIEYAIKAYNIARIRLDITNGSFIRCVDIIKFIINKIYVPSTYESGRFGFCDESGDDYRSGDYENYVVDTNEHQYYIGGLVNDIREAENEESIEFFIKLCEASHTMSDESLKYSLLYHGYCNVRPKLIETINNISQSNN